MPYLIFLQVNAQTKVENNNGKDTRMQWWQEGRFGMFIHWGLYAIPAGEWKERTDHGEWIRTTAEIPLTEYDKLVKQFKPKQFDAAKWVKMAKDAGMKYIVITSKHHDGFCMFNSQYTDFDIMSTPYKKDILKELADACGNEGIKLCFYYSIMDWHHPDYLPRRDWENDRENREVDFARYITYMKNQIKELITNYGDIGVLWFDGEWEKTWNHDYAADLYNFIKSLKPGIIINDRLDIVRNGTNARTKEDYYGDFSTPEQEIPATGMPGVDWETCMTMNDHWGYNKNDNAWKSSADLIRKLADISSKGGNFLLNVGPAPEGTFPDECIKILKELGSWMKVNNEAIYGTKAGPFNELSWGKCTQKKNGYNTRLYFHVFSWQDAAKLIIPGIANKPLKAYLLADPEMAPLSFSRSEDKIIIDLPQTAPDPVNTVVVLDIEGPPDVCNPPEIIAATSVFTDYLQVTISEEKKSLQVRYTTDGSEPVSGSQLYTGIFLIDKTSCITARYFRDDKPSSSSSNITFTKVKPWMPLNVKQSNPGLKYSFYEGKWDALPDFSKMNPSRTGISPLLNIQEKASAEGFGYEFNGFLKVTTNNVYVITISSDDGSRLFIDGKLVADNDGLHGMLEKKGEVPLAAGMHKIKVQYFEKSGDNDLKVYIKSRDMQQQLLPAHLLFN